MRQDARFAATHLEDYALEHAAIHKLSDVEIIWALIEAVKNMQERHVENVNEVGE